MSPPALIEVVDDDEDVRRMMVMVLESHGFKVRAHDGGASYLKSSKASAPRVMLLDVRMPQMSGIELQIRLREAGDDIPVIFMSGESLPHETQAAQRSDAIAFLCKPFHTMELLKAIEAGLEKQTQVSNKPT
jgi:FixJ family two-component response regulator